MATAVFWLSVLFGLPLIVAGVASILFAGVLELIIGERWKQIPDWVFAIPEGIVAMAAGGLLARWLLGDVPMTVPLALSAIATIWHLQRGEPSRILPYAAAIFVMYLAWLR